MRKREFVGVTIIGAMICFICSIAHGGLILRSW